MPCAKTGHPIGRGCSDRDEAMPILGRVSVNTTDEIFVDAEPADVYRALLTFGKDASWWPGAKTETNGRRITVAVPAGAVARVRFVATVDNVRPDEGLTWVFEDGELSGRGEWWLEPFKDGTIVHYYLIEADKIAGARGLDSLVDKHRVAMRRGMNALKDFMEGR